ncbi:hypothetical protein [Winogradskyella undariae]|uniref:hypothetical protein n=1 Tax=Winogradskyella undariae TaxID=1285465 RepID=UPI0015C92CDE|nr:hypothetical protein [Winogradskyella undariae]
MSQKSLKFSAITTLLVATGFFMSIHAQQIIASGKVSDTLQNSLAYANILAVPQADDQYIKFAITEKDVSYKLGLVKN